MRITSKKCDSTGKQTHLCRCDVCFQDWLAIRRVVEKSVKDMNKAMKNKKKKSEKLNF